MAKVFADISVSLDGYVAGPAQTLEEPLGERGESLHEWALATTAWRESHGRSGGETNADSEVVDEISRGTGAVVMGRRMFSGGEGPWEADPNPDAWWGDEPPFHMPVFVLTHHPREPLEKVGTTFHFVTDGVEAAIERARDAAGGGDVHVAGGASAVGQCLDAGLLDELQVHLVAVLLGGGSRLFDGVDSARVGLEIDRVIASPAVTHLRYRVNRDPQEGS